MSGCIHTDQAIDQQSVIEDGIDKLRQAGYKITKRRTQLLELFADYDRYMSATQVHEILSQDHPTMSYNTTYRNLYDFVELGILELTEFNQEQNFILACLADHHHHFICQKCGLVKALDVCPMDHVRTDLSEFKVLSHRFEVFGLCPQCQLLSNDR